MINSTTLILSLPRPGRISDFFNSRLRPPDIHPNIVAAILSRYGLEMTAPPANLPNTRRNRNLIVHTRQGRKILKHYRVDWRASTIIFEHSILARLAELDFPAPRLIPAQDGRTWLTMDSHNYCLFDFIEGTNYSSSFLVRPQRVRMMAASGRMLARLHRQLTGFLPEGQHHLGFKDYRTGRHRDLAWHIEKVRELVARSRGLKNPEDRAGADWLVNHSARLLVAMRQLDEALDKADLPRLIIHGDYGLHNLIYQNLDSTVPVDYELARLEWRLCDLVSVVSKFRYKDGAYDFESITGFMRAYQAEFPIDRAEWQHFPLVWKFYKLMKAVQYWSSYFETDGPARKLRSAKDEILQSDWALENPGRLGTFKEDNR